MRAVWAMAVAGSVAMVACQGRAPATSPALDRAPAEVRVSLPRPTFVVGVDRAGSALQVTQFDSSGNITIKVPAGYEAYGQQVANDINSGVPADQAIRRVVASLKAAGADAKAVLRQVGQLNAGLVAMARLMGQDLPGITSAL